MCKIHNLAFFVIVFLGCSSRENTAIKIVWVDNKATAIYLPADLFKNIPPDSLPGHVIVIRRGDKDSTAILGELLIKNNIVFEPLLPFSRATGYEVLYKNDKIAGFEVPAADARKPPELLNIYPGMDTLPENLLKLYLEFSHPMSEGQSDRYLTVIRNGTDTLREAFLNLQPELWNKDRTVITVWFDPGRIKRDLQPNLRLGAPLRAMEKYELVVSRNWKDAQGVALPKDFKKDFFTSTRDSLSSKVDHWSVRPVPQNSTAALIIEADEPLDHYLFADCLSIKDGGGSFVKGSFEIEANDRIARFTPASPWLAGNYFLNVEPKLEDLAGNNLNRPFDRDVTATTSAAPKDIFIKPFRISANP